MNVIHVLNISKGHLSAVHKHLFRLVKVSDYTFLNGGTTCFYLMHIKIVMNIVIMGFGLVKVHCISYWYKVKISVITVTAVTGLHSFPSIIFTRS